MPPTSRKRSSSPNKKEKMRQKKKLSCKKRPVLALSGGDLVPMERVSIRESGFVQYPWSKNLGSGSSATVYVPFNNETIVIKRNNSAIERINDRYPAFIREIIFLNILQHPHIIKMHKVLVDENFVPHPVFSRMEGNLIELYSKTGNFTASAVKEFAKQMLSALDYIHSHGVLHSDIKPENIVYSKIGDNKNIYYLCDFGLSQFYGIPAPKRHYITTPAYGPNFNNPNRDKRFDEYNMINIDTFSLGLTIVYLVTGNNRISNPVDFFQKSSNKPVIDSIINVIKMNGWKFLLDTWGVNPINKNRIPSARELLGHPFFFPVPPRPRTTTTTLELDGGDDFHYYTFNEMKKYNRDLAYLVEMEQVYKNFQIMPRVNITDGWEQYLIRLCRFYVEKKLVPLSTTIMAACIILRSYSKPITTVTIQSAFYLATTVFESGAYPFALEMIKYNLASVPLRQVIIELLGSVEWKNTILPFLVYIEEYIRRFFYVTEPIKLNEIIQARKITQIYMLHIFLEPKLYDLIVGISYEQLSRIVFTITIYIMFDKQMKFEPNEFDSNIQYNDYKRLVMELANTEFSIKFFNAYRNNTITINDKTVPINFF